jgi:prepilin-type N-terminal cleavage/methylation domain-containing protein
VTALLRRLRGDDRGLTLIEVVVSIVILSVAMILFTGGMLQIYRNLNKTESMSTVQTQLNVAYLRLDKEIRYASAISTQATQGSNYYFRYLISNTGTQTCVELKLDGTAKQLLRRTWTHTTGTPVPSAWLPLARNVTATNPFLTPDPTGTQVTPRVQVNIRAWSGASNDATSRASNAVFTALNASGGVADASVCSEGDSVP